MAKHQIIYTSCMRGIDGANDGQQIFSYDRDFSNAKSDEVKSLFTYSVPSLEAGQIMTEELAKEMPSAFMYRYLEGYEQCAISLNTYLGRDYMGSSGRFGNHLSHSIVCDFADFDMYPCELYGSDSLRDHMEYEEVNNPNPPDYLPSPELNKGYIADIDSILEFLEEEENLEILKKMIVAMISFNSERKRVIICDEPQRIVKWIAALQYVLPLDIAKRINFTTYEFDPELSPACICGVIKSGSRYNSQSYLSSGHHFVFDFIDNVFSNIETGDEPFIDFADTSLSFSYDSLKDFFDFIIKDTNYRNLDEKYYSGYLLYSLFSDGFSEITENQFTRLTEFADAHLSKSKLIELLSIIVNSDDVISSFDNGYAIKVLNYLLKYSKILSAEQIEVIKHMAVVMITNLLSENGISEEDFFRIYETVDSMTRAKGISVPAELMNTENRSTVLGVLSENIAGWKIFSIIRIISDYVKDLKMRCEELYPDHETGKLYKSIFDAVISADPSKGPKLITCLLDNFKINASYLSHMAINIEGYLRDKPDGQRATEFLWTKYSEYISKYNSSQVSEAVSIFSTCERYDLLCRIHCARLNAVCQIEEARAMINDIANGEFKLYPIYANKYAATVFGTYYKKFANQFNDGSNEAIDYSCELLNLSMLFMANGDYVDALIDTVAHSMPIGKMDRNNCNLINEIIEYQGSVRGMSIEGYLLLLAIGIYFANMLNKNDIARAPSAIFRISGNKPVRFDEDEKTRDKYFDWILPNILKYSLVADDYKAVFSLFNMSVNAKNEFMLYCCKESFKKSKKGSKDVVDFSEFLLFVFDSGDRDDIDLIGKYLCKLSKQKLADLDEGVREVFFKNIQATQKWEKIREIAESTNPLMNSLSGLFKKMKD